MTICLFMPRHDRNKDMKTLFALFQRSKPKLKVQIKIK